MPNYNMLLQAPNAGNAFAQGIQQGQQTRYRNRLLDNQDRRLDLADKQFGLQEQQFGLEQQKVLAAETRQKAEQLGSLLMAAKQNPAAYQQIAQQAVAAGLTTPDKIPPQYDPAWIDTQIASVTDITTKIDQQFSREERVAGQEFTAEQNQLNRANRLQAAQTRAGAKKPTADEERRQQIVAQLKARNIPLDEYMVNGIVAGTIDVKMDPKEGRVILTDVLAPGGPTATEIPLRGAGGASAAQAAPGQPEAEPVFPYGAEGNIRGIADEWIGVIFGDPEVAESRQAARLLREEMISAFSRSGRPSTFAQQRVEELLPSMSNVAADADSAVAQLERSSAYLTEEIRDAQIIANDASRPSKERASARSQVEAGRKALRMIDRIVRAHVPEGGGGVLSPEDRALIEKYRQ